MQRKGARMFLRVAFPVRIAMAGMGFSYLLLSGCHAANGPAPSQDTKTTQEPNVELDDTEVSSEFANRPVKSIRLFKRNAGRADWSPDGQTILYHGKGRDGYYDLYTMNNDGRGVKCLTCNHKDLPNKHIGEASWHPSGDWIVFKAEMKDHVLPRRGALAAPGIGYHNNVYAMTPDAKKVYQLTDLDTKKGLFDRTPTCAVLNPHFSKDGKRVSWSERLEDGGKWGKWGIRVSDFVVENGVPTLKNMHTFKPGNSKLYYESNDFMPGDEKLIICGNLEYGQSEHAIDIYYLDLATRKTQRLTHSRGEFNECPHPSPDGSKIAYLSASMSAKSQDDGGRKKKERWDWWNTTHGDFWLMDGNGGGKVRLTYFSEEGYPEYIGKRVVPAAVCWNKNGTTLLLGIAVELEEKELEDQLYIVELKEPAAEAAAVLPAPQ